MKWKRRFKLAGLKCECGAMLNANIADLGAHYINVHKVTRDDAYAFAYKEIKRFQKARDRESFIEKCKNQTE